MWCQALLFPVQTHNTALSRSLQDCAHFHSIIHRPKARLPLFTRFSPSSKVILNNSCMQRINGVIFYFHLLVQIHLVFSPFSISSTGKKKSIGGNIAESPSVSERAWLLRFITLEQPRHLALLFGVFFFFFLVVNEPLNLSALSPTRTSMTANRFTVNLLGQEDLNPDAAGNENSHRSHTL